MFFLLFRVGPAGHHSYFRHESSERCVAVRFLTLFMIIPLIPVSGPILLRDPQGPCQRRYNYTSMSCSCIDFLICYLFAWLRIFTLGIICFVKCPASESRKEAILAAAGLSAGGAALAATLLDGSSKEGKTREGADADAFTNPPAVQKLVDELSDCRNPSTPADAAVLIRIAVKVGAMGKAKLARSTPSFSKKQTAPAEASSEPNSEEKKEGREADDTDDAPTAVVSGSDEAPPRVEIGLRLRGIAIEIEPTSRRWLDLAGALASVGPNAPAFVQKRSMTKVDCLAEAVAASPEDASTWNDAGSKLRPGEALPAARLQSLGLPPTARVNDLECFRQAFCLRPTFDMALRNIALMMPADGTQIHLPPLSPNAPATRQQVLLAALRSYTNDAKLLALLGDTLPTRSDTVVLHTGQAMTAKDLYWSACMAKPDALLKTSLLGLQRVATSSDAMQLPNGVVISQRTIPTLLLKAVATHPYQAPTNPLASQQQQQQSSGGGGGGGDQ